MVRYIIDENLPADLDIWSSLEFLHTNNIPHGPKVVWFRVGNIIKSDLENFIGGIWSKVEVLLKTKNFLIVTKDYIEAL